jgi:hypothetical protein
MRTTVARPELGYQIVGFVDDNPQKGQTDIGPFKALGPLRNLPGLIEEEAVDEVIVTLPWMYHRKIMSIVRECERRQVNARIVPDLFQMSLSRVDVDDLGGVPLIGVREVGFERRTRLIKRGTDVVGANAWNTVPGPDRDEHPARFAWTHRHSPDSRGGCLQVVRVSHVPLNAGGGRR